MQGTSLLEAAASAPAGGPADLRRMAALQERLEAAERKRAARLEAVRLRAAGKLPRGAAAAAAAATAGASAGGAAAPAPPRMQLRRSLSIEEDFAAAGAAPAGPRTLVLQRVSSGAGHKGAGGQPAGRPASPRVSSPRKCTLVRRSTGGLSMLLRPQPAAAAAAAGAGGPAAAAGTAAADGGGDGAKPLSADARRARWVAHLQAAAVTTAGRAGSPRAAGAAAAAAAEQLRRAVSSRRVQRRWREFAAERKTTAALAAAFVACGVTALTAPEAAEGGGSSAADGDSSGSPAVAVPAATTPPRPAPERTQSSSAGGLPPRPPPLQPPASPPPPPPPAPAAPVFIGGVGAAPARLPRHESFDEFAARMQAPATLRAAAALFRRLEQRRAARFGGAAAAGGAQALLARLFPAAAASGRRIERYPPRVLLVAFMVRRHPEVVFNKVGDVEAHLSGAACSMLAALEALLAKVLEGAAGGSGGSGNGSGGFAFATPPPSPGAAAPASVLSSSPATAFSPLRASAAAWRDVLDGDSASGSGTANGASADGTAAAAATATAAAAATLGQLLAKFDDEWLEYLDQFVLWKGQDAAGLEAELVGCAMLLLRGGGQSPGLCDLARLETGLTDSLLRCALNSDARHYAPLSLSLTTTTSATTTTNHRVDSVAVKLERSMRRKLFGRDPSSEAVRANPDLRAMVSQVAHDHSLLAERVARLTGADGAARLAAALEAAREEVAAEVEAAGGDDGQWSDAASESGRCGQATHMKRDVVMVGKVAGVWGIGPRARASRSSIEAHARGVGSRHLLAPVRPVTGQPAQLFVGGASAEPCHALA